MNFHCYLALALLVKTLNEFNIVRPYKFRSVWGGNSSSGIFRPHQFIFHGRRIS